LNFEETGQISFVQSYFIEKGHAIVVAYWGYRGIKRDLMYEQTYNYYRIRLTIDFHDATALRLLSPNSSQLDYHSSPFQILLPFHYSIKDMSCYVFHQLSISTIAS
jgi:hypothetical protein